MRFITSHLKRLWAATIVIQHFAVLFALSMLLLGCAVAGGFDL